MTIRRRIRVALFLMMLVPAFLMIAGFGIARRLSAGVNRGDAYKGPLMLSGRERTFLAEFNRLAVEDPGSLSDPRGLARLDQSYAGEPWGWRVLRGTEELYRSARFDEEHRWRPRSFSRVTPAQPDISWDFRFPDGRTGTLQVSSRMSWGFPFRGTAWFAAFIAVVVICNGLLGWWISSSVISPLARLRDAALRIGEGDLGFQLASGGPDEFGQVIGAFETMRAKLEAAVNRQLAEETSRKELIAHVSHDLRTPINIIRGYAEGIRDGVASTAEMRARYLATILERAGELERLIELLFSYSTINLEGVRPVLADVPVLPFLRDLHGSLSPAFPSAGIVLGEAPDGADARETTAPPVPPNDLRIRADVELTRRVMSNLVENAVKHGGRATVSVQWNVRRGVGPGTVEIVVADNGVGVTATDLPRIFEPFFRGDPARSRQQGGSGAGLGLSIVSTLMRAQGGAVRALSAPGHGLEITLTFPEAPSGAEANPDH